MLAASIVSGGTHVNTSNQIAVITETQITEDSVDTSESLTTKEQVEEYFSDVPIMSDIAYCESRYRQYDSNGNVLRGEVNSLDVGVLQINETYHADTAVKLGINIYTLEGNMAYARYLYETQGTRPWIHSSHCWNTSREVALR